MTKVAQYLAQIHRVLEPMQRKPTKADQLLKLLARSKGATVVEIEAQLSWQPHPIRAATSRLRAAGSDIKLERSGKTARYCTIQETTQ
jgi:hypothetical protein